MYFRRDEDGGSSTSGMCSSKNFIYLKLRVCQDVLGEGEIYGYVRTYWEKEKHEQDVLGEGESNKADHSNCLLEVGMSGTDT